MGASRLSDVATWDSRGVLILNPSAELNDDQLAAIASIKEVPGLLGSSLEVTLHNKVSALKDLRRHLAPSPAEARFGLPGSGGSATIVIEGGPTGLEINIHPGAPT